MKRFVIVIVSLTTLLIVLLAIYHKDLESLRPYQNPKYISKDSLCIISGHVEGFGINTIGLSYRIDSGWYKLIHIEQHHGDFLVKLKIGEPCYANLSYHQYNWLPKYGKHSYGRLIIQPGDVIYIEGKADSLQNLRIIGSPLTTESDSFDKVVLGQIQKDFQSAFLQTKANHKSEFDSITKISDKNIQNREWMEFSDKYSMDSVTDAKYYLAYIKAHPGSVVSALKLTRLYKFLNPDECMKVYESLDSNIKVLSYAKSFKKRIEALAKTQIGMVAPDISLPDPDGHRTNLSDLKGKVVLLYFWINGDQYDCLHGRSPAELLKVYHKYHQKGFEIYAVSMNRSKKKWMEVIKRDSMIWINVLDTNTRSNYVDFTKYGLSADQSNILIDRDGKVLDRDIRSARLKDKLEELLK